MTQYDLTPHPSDIACLHSSGDLDLVVLWPHMTLPHTPLTYLLSLFLWWPWPWLLCDPMTLPHTPLTQPLSPFLWWPWPCSFVTPYDLTPHPSDISSVAVPLCCHYPPLGRTWPCSDVTPLVVNISASGRPYIRSHDLSINRYEIEVMFVWTEYLWSGFV